MDRCLEAVGTSDMEDSTQGWEEMKRDADKGSALKVEMPVCPSSQNFVSVTFTVPVGSEYEYLEQT